MRGRIGGEITRKIDALIIHFTRLVVIHRRLIFEVLGEILVIQAVKFRR